ncbi:hypothetical protein DEO72_LG8g1321 [Vigna unguiculata]|uniref:Uncharacterized protein n=1 Tax=Vigna unguiculata TaxID=3917 RepID=A0A4D6MTT1_VIGUN|nr:hypothetical protein DEO72_LG8g1321 [Vigna unguiculata]
MYLSPSENTCSMSFSLSERIKIRIQGCSFILRVHCKTVTTALLPSRVTHCAARIQTLTQPVVISVTNTRSFNCSVRNILEFTPSRPFRDRSLPTRVAQTSEKPDRIESHVHSAAFSLAFCEIQSVEHRLGEVSGDYCDGGASSPSMFVEVLKAM